MKACPKLRQPPRAPPPGTAPITDIAAAAIDKAEGKKDSAAKPAAKAKPAASPPAPVASTLDKPFIQIGIFSVQANADNTATSLRTRGVVPIVKAQEARGKKFWRVLIGPAKTGSERAALLRIARRLGFDDAYFVTN